MAQAARIHSISQEPDPEVHDHAEEIKRRKLEVHREITLCRRSMPLGMSYESVARAALIKYIRMTRPGFSATWFSFYNSVRGLNSRLDVGELVLETFREMLDARQG